MIKTYRDYYNALVAHDWYFGFSDSTEVYVCARANLHVLEVIAEKNAVCKAMFEAFKHAYFIDIDGVQEPKVPDIEMFREHLVK